MEEYRAYFTEPDGHLIGFVGLYCLNDNVAIELAKRLVFGNDVELRSGDRVVAKLDSSHSQKRIVLH